MPNLRNEVNEPGCERRRPGATSGHRILAAAILVALVATACGSSDQSATTSGPGTTLSPATSSTSVTPEAFTPGEVIGLDVSRASANVTEADIAAVVASDVALGLGLFRVAAGDDNMMVSPYSVAAALSMLYPGARSTTATEIADVLQLAVDEATLHAVRNHIDTALAAPPARTDDTDTREPFTIRPANSAWGQGGYPFLDGYLGVLAENYGAGLRLLDFVGDPEGSRGIINGWVEDATENRIKDLIPEGAISVDTRMALVNAIWFKANWFQPFDVAASVPGSFTLLDGSERQVPLMHAAVRTGYATTDLFEAVRLPYAGDAAMVLLLPKLGSPADLAGALVPASLDISWGDYMVDVTLPSFEFESDIDLKAALQELGLRAAFEPPFGSGADLTGITPVRELFVSGAFHKTFIALDEEGTEAAAATAIIVSRESLPQPATFTANRPFLFWIEHTPTGEMLFLGQVTEPT